MLTAAVGEPMKRPGYLLATGTYCESREMSDGRVTDEVRTKSKGKRREKRIIIERYELLS